MKAHQQTVTEQFWERQRIKIIIVVVIIIIVIIICHSAVAVNGDSVSGTPGDLVPLDNSEHRCRHAAKAVVLRPNKDLVGGRTCGFDPSLISVCVTAAASSS